MEYISNKKIGRKYDNEFKVHGDTKLFFHPCGTFLVDTWQVAYKNIEFL